jgi:hypothetical protein
MNNLTKHLVQARIDDLYRDAGRTRGGAVTSGSRGGNRETLATPITIRRATYADAAGLRRVAEVDSSEVPAAPMLLAEVDGEVRAAVSLADGALVADPFHDTRAIVELLEACAAHELTDGRSRLRRRFGRVLRRGGRRAGGRMAGGPVEVLR